MLKMTDAVPGVATVKAAWAAGKVWFLLALVLLLLVIGAWAGHKWAAGETQAALRQKDAAVADRDAWKAASGTWQKATKTWADRFKADEAEASRQRAQAAKVLDQLAAAAEKARREREAWERRYRDALKNPDCAELAKATTCAAFSRY